MGATQGPRVHRVPSVAMKIVADDRGHRTPCWIWHGAKQPNGYGVVNREGRTHRAHRWIYERFRQPVPSGMDLDHLCRQRDCVNPLHLEPVSRGVNLRRGDRGKTAPHTLFLLHLMDGSTTLTRVELAELLGISGRSVTRYLGSQGHGRNYELRLRQSPGPHDVKHRWQPTAARLF